MLSNLPPATRALLLANVGVFVLELLTGTLLLQWFALWPPGTLFEPWQLITYAFLHDPNSFTHILFNMLTLFMFGTPLERYWGSGRFTAFYFVCVLAAGLTQIAVAIAAHSQTPTLGASGGIFGLLLAFAFYFPRQRIMLLFPPIPMPAWVLVTLYGLAELFLGVTGNQAGVAHFAHLGGMLGGAAVILFWRVKDGAPRRQ
jgi:membrane associated rhomboid family serine protease